MQINPYLSFNGQCEAAFKFYAACLGGKILAMMPYGDTPAACNGLKPEFHDRIMHARLQVGDTLLMGSDTPPEMFEEAKGITVTLNLADPTEADRVFHALAEGGKICVPIEKTFWALRFGMLVDRFGIPWMINCEAAVIEAQPAEKGQGLAA